MKTSAMRIENSHAFFLCIITCFNIWRGFSLPTG